MAYKYKIWVRRSDTHDYIGNEDILVGNAGNEHSKFTSGLTIDKAFSYVEFDSWEDLIESITGSGCTPELTCEAPEDIALGVIPQAGGTWVLTAKTTCNARVINFISTAGSGVVTITPDLSDPTNATCTMSVTPNSSREEERPISIEVKTDVEGLSYTWNFTQSTADWEVEDADYLLFTYDWRNSPSMTPGTDGGDLDTFTFLQFSNQTAPHCPDEDRGYARGVGYSGLYTVLREGAIDTGGQSPYLLTFDPEKTYLAWAGDNTGDQGEHTFVNFKKIKDYCQTNRVNATVYIMGNWYRCKNEGNCTIKLRAFRGGTPDPHPSKITGFTINGGQQIGGEASVVNKCYARSRDNSSPEPGYINGYTLLSFMQYVYQENKIYLYSVENNPGAIDKLPANYQNLIGQYRAFVYELVVTDSSGNTIYSGITNQHETGQNGAEVEFEISGSDTLTFRIIPHRLYFSCNVKDITYISASPGGFRVNNCGTPGGVDEEIVDHYGIQQDGPSGDVGWEMEILFSDEGTYKADGTRGFYIPVYSALSSTFPAPNPDTFYINIKQRKAEPPVTGQTTLEFVPIAWRGTEFNTTNGIGSSLLVIKTGNGQKLSEINTTYENEMAAFNNFGPFYLGDGMYFYEICKTLGYQTGVNYAAYKTKVKINSPDLDTNYEIISSASQIEHSVCGRILNVRSPFTYYTLDYIPASGATIKKELCGLAFDAQEIVGNKMMHLNETWQQEVETDYTPQVFTVFPNNAEEMLSASLVLDYETTSATTIISPNTHPYPRVGYVQIPPYSGNRLIFVQNGTKKIFGFYPEYMKIYQTGNDVSNWRFMIDLDELHTEEKVLEFQRFSPSSICFHKGVSSLIKVVDGNGAVLSPVEKTDTDTGLIFETYESTQTSSPCKFIISLKNE